MPKTPERKRYDTCLLLTNLKLGYTYQKHDSDNLIKMLIWLNSVNLLRKKSFTTDNINGDDL